MNWLSLFDGGSGGQIAATELRLPITKYYASEVDKRPIEITKLLFPNTIHIGDVRKVEVSLLDKIDIVIGGSPCTDLSFAGKMSGMICESLGDYIELRSEYLQTGDEKLYFHNGKFQQSILFWEYLRILRDVQSYNPDVKFFLENVRMDKKYQNMISENLGVEPQNINSRLVSAQNRNRWYWSNIKTEQKTLFGMPETSIPIPADRGLVLRDILQPESKVDEKYYIKNQKLNFAALDINEKAKTLRVGGAQTQSQKHNYDIIKVDKQGKVKEDQEKGSCFTAGGNSGGNHSDMDLICIAQRGRNPENPSSRVTSEYLEQTFEPRTDDKTNCITSVGKDNLVFEYSSTPICLNYNTAKHQQDRIYHENGKSPSMTASNNDDKRVLVNYRIRRLTPSECLRLQTVPENMIDEILSSGIKDSPIYKMAGNGWTIEVIKEYFKHLKTET